MEQKTAKNLIIEKQQGIQIDQLFKENLKKQLTNKAVYMQSIRNQQQNQELDQEQNQQLDVDGNWQNQQEGNLVNTQEQDLIKQAQKKRFLGLGNFALYGLLAVFGFIFALSMYQLVQIELGNNTDDKVVQKDKDDETVVAADLGLVEVEAENAKEENLVEIDTKFVVKTQKETTTDKVAAATTITPKVAFEVEEKNEKEFVIKPQENLKPNTVYNVQVANEDVGEPISWAFQVKDTFRIISTIPADKSTNVPINAGIEVEFSSENLPDNYDEFIKFDPQIEGRYENQRGNVIFKPSSLSYSTVYTVTIQNEIQDTATNETLPQDYIFQFETERNYEDSANTQSLRLERQNYEYATTENPAFDVSIRGAGNNPNEQKLVDINIYQFPDEVLFVEALNKIASEPSWAVYGYERDTLKNLPTEQKILELNDYQLLEPTGLPSSSSGIVQLPESLPTGFYWIEIRFNDSSTKSLLQITDISAYFAANDNETVVWVHDLKTKEPRDGATVSFIETGDFITKEQSSNTQDSRIKTTGDDGTATLISTDRIKEDLSQIIKVESGTSILYLSTDIQDVFSGSNYYARTGQRQFGDDYWKYLYMDKTSYRNTDTINIWGTIRSRNITEVGSLENRSLEAIIIDPSLSTSYSQPYERDTYNTNNVVLRRELDWQEGGTFVDSIEIENFRAGYYKLLILLDENKVINEYFTVGQYQTPNYTGEINVDKRFLKQNEDLQVSGKVELYGGAAASNLELSYGGNSFKDGKVKTNAKGKFSFITSVKDDATIFSSPRIDHIFIRNSLEEEYGFNMEKAVVVVPTDVDLNVEIDNSDTVNHKIEVSAYNIDFDKANSTDTVSTNIADFYSSPAEGAAVSVEVIEKTYEKKEDGEFYNYITKQLEKSYTYDEKDVQRTGFDLTLDESGRGNLSIKKLDNENHYEVIVKMQGTDGQEIKIQRRIYNYTKPTNTLDVYELSSNLEGKYDVGQKDTIKIIPNYDQNDLAKEIDREAEQYLFLRNSRGLREHTIANTDSIEIEYTEEDIPNVYFSAVVFNETYNTYFTTNVLDKYYDETSKNLTVDLQTSNTESKLTNKFKPGEEVEIQVQVTDENGEPKKTIVNIGVVDEVVYENSRENQYQSLFFSTTNLLYQPVYSGIIDQNYSHYKLLSDLGTFVGGLGGKAAESIRSDFDDNPAFVQIETDENGVGNYKFTLPDNLTSWIISARAVSDDIYPYFGSGEKKLSASLPYFVDPVVSDEYLIGDEPVISIRSFGESIENTDADNQNIDYKINSDTLNINDEFQAKAGEVYYYDLPELVPGDHKLVVSGQYGDYEDAIEKTFKVVESRNLVKSTSEPVELNTTYTPDLDNGQFAKLVLTNSSTGKVYPDINTLVYSNYGDAFNRAEAILASNKAKELLKEYFDAGNLDNKLELTPYVRQDGGISILPYSGADLELTAIYLGLFGDNADIGSHKKYLYSIYNNVDESQKRLAASMYGLASLGEPLLNQVKEFANAGDSLDMETKLYLTLALAEYGDIKNAMHLWDQGITSQIKETEGKLFVKDSDGDQEQSYMLTTIALVAATKLDNEVAEQMYQYLKNTDSDKHLSLMQEVYYLDRMLSEEEPREASFSYSYDSVSNKEVQLSKYDSYNIYITASKLDSLEFVDIVGNIDVMVEKYISSKNTDANISNQLSINKRYLVNGVESTNFKTSDLIKVEIDYSIANPEKDSCYMVRDYVPAGTRIISSYKIRNRIDNFTEILVYPTELTGKKINFCALPEGKKIVYFLRIVNKGNYIIPQAVIQENVGSKIKYSNSGKVLID